MEKIKYKQGYNPNSRNGFKKGVQFSKEYRKKISDGRKGMKFSKKHKKNLSLAKLGKKLSNEHIRNISIARLNSNHITKPNQTSFKKGHKLSEESKKKISIANKGHVSLTKGKKWEEIYGKEKTKTLIKNYKEKMKHVVTPKKDTSIELKIQDFLTSLKIEFFTHKYMNIKNSYQCDIFIPFQSGISQKTIIECDGDFFHMNPNKFSPYDKIFKNGIIAKERWKLDEDRTKQLIDKGFKVLRLWEFEIRAMNINKFKDKLKQ